MLVSVLLITLNLDSLILGRKWVSAALVVKLLLVTLPEYTGRGEDRESLCHLAVARDVRRLQRMSIIARTQDELPPALGASEPPEYQFKKKQETNYGFCFQNKIIHALLPLYQFKCNFSRNGFSSFTCVFTRTEGTRMLTPDSVETTSLWYVESVCPGTGSDAF